MDLEGIVEKIPSTEKILGVVWIVSWILAIWIYHVQFFLTGLFCLFLVLILIGRFEKKEEKTSKRPAIFTMDKNTRTLTVQKLYEDDLKWDEHEICSGDATLYPQDQSRRATWSLTVKVILLLDIYLPIPC